jgi:hypothetical protein
MGLIMFSYIRHREPLRLSVVLFLIYTNNISLSISLQRYIVKIRLELINSF